MKAVVAAFNQEKALVGAFSVITNLRMMDLGLNLYPLLQCAALCLVIQCLLSRLTAPPAAYSIYSMFTGNLIVHKDAQSLNSYSSGAFQKGYDFISA